MADNDDVGKIVRCACGSTATQRVTPETRRIVGWNQCDACFTKLFRNVLENGGDCETCTHPNLLHSSGCIVPYCKCRLKP